jgi:hypothetical protein
MIKLLEEAIASVGRLPERDQELAAEFLLGFSNPDAHRYHLNDKQVREVQMAKREMREGKLATDSEMEDVWRKFSR